MILESGQYVGQFKKYYLIFEVAIANSEGCFKFIVFSNPYLTIRISQIELGKMSNSNSSIQ